MNSWQRSTGYFGHSRPEIREFIPQQRERVLEVGCGEARFSALLGGISELWGIEPDEDAAAVAATVMHRVLCGTFESQREELPDLYFDLIICNDVIEHMSDHDKFFVDAKKKLRPGGHIVGSIPNVRHCRNLFELLVRRDWRYRNEGILDRTHLRFFTYKSLQRSLRDAGYNVVSIKFINLTLWPAKTLRDAILLICSMAVVAGTLGKWRDILYLQIGFCASPIASAPRDRANSEPRLQPAPSAEIAVTAHVAPDR